MRATLGSCVGLGLVHAATGKIALAHVLLPEPPESHKGPVLDPARYASTVVSHMLEGFDLGRRGTRGLRAYVAGGARMFEGTSQKNSVGLDNQTALLASLAAHKILVVGRDLGGTSGRQLVIYGPSAVALSLNLDNPETSPSWEFPASFPRPPLSERNE